MRAGIGYDVHKLVTGRRLILGGVEIPFAKGLSGHSDADVLTHAIMDALLGAAGLRDIGSQFPPDDPKYKDISSLLLLDEVNKLVWDKGFIVVNIDAVIVAQQPKISPFIDDMRRLISRRLGINLEQLMVKATTTDGLGFAGRGEGMAAYAVALVEEK
jgi:2-C-methyl-D-erythritol 2,4-cyclodiphosphate synthase